MRDNIEEYKRYIRKCEMLGTRMFEFKIEDGGDIYIIKYIPNDEVERIVKIPDFVSGVAVHGGVRGHGGFEGVTQRIRLTGGENIKELSFQWYKGGKIDISSINTSKMRIMDEMFWGCSEIKELDIGNFDTRNVKTMAFMFSGCSSIEELDLRNFDTRNVKEMRNMFSNCSVLRKLNVRSFDTKQVKNMRYMFCDCSSIKELDLSSFDTRQVEDMRYMFSGCRGLEKLDISNFDTRSIMTREEATDAMFSGCKKLKLIITNRKTKAWLSWSWNRKRTCIPKGCKIEEK